MITGDAARRMIRFGAVGGCSALIYAGLAYGFDHAGLAAMPASVAAYGLAAVFSFNAHRRVTFNSKAPPRAELLRFLAVNAMGLSLAILTPLILTEALDLPPLVAIAAVCVLVPALSFLLMDRFVFRPGAPPLERAVARP